MFSSVASFICFYCSAFCDTYNQNITSVYVFDPLHESNRQIQEHHELSDICYYISYLKQLSEFESVLALAVVVLIKMTSTSYTQSCQYLTHKAISNLTIPHLKADHSMLRVFASSKLIQPSELIDLKKSQEIFVSSKALGGGHLCKVEGPCSITSCGRNEKSSKY